MRATSAAAAALAVAGLAVLGYAVATGQATLALVLVFPVVAGTGPAGALGVLLLFGAAAVAALDWAQAIPSSRGPHAGDPWDRAEPPRPDFDEWAERVLLPRRPPQEGEGPSPRVVGQPRARGGGFLLLGPIPIAWGSDRGLAGLMAMAAVLALASLVVLLLLGWPSRGGT